MGKMAQGAVNIRGKNINNITGCRGKFSNIQIIIQKNYSDIGTAE